MSYALSILIILLGLQAQAECQSTTALTLSADFKTAYGVPKVGYGPFYEGYSWDVLTSKVTGKFDGVGWPGVYATTEFLKSSRDGKYLIGLAYNYLVVWDVKSQQRIVTKRFPRDGLVGFVEMAGDNLVLVRRSGHLDFIDEISVINVKSGETVYQLFRPTNAPFTMNDTRIAISETGNILYVAYIENSPDFKYILTRIDILDGKKLSVEISDSHPRLFESHGKLYTYNYDSHHFETRMMRVYDAANLELVEEYVYPEANYGWIDPLAVIFQVSPQQGIAKIGTRNVVDLKTGKILFRFDNEIYAIDSYLSVDGKTFGVVNHQYVHLYDTSTWKLKSSTCFSNSTRK